MNKQTAKKRTGEIQNRRARRRGETSVNSGLIDPTVVADYSKIIPNAADRILSMTERQLRHEQWIEKFVVGCNSIRPLLGIMLAASLFFCLLAAGFLCILYGHDTAGVAIIGSTPLAGLVAKFIYGTKN
ncbi:MAG: DUF2335 domain-containing protein [Acidobacteriota bacterium]|nr:DUF2335 domain-containing protein [Acidobacteriota bacterium]